MYRTDLQAGDSIQIGAVVVTLESKTGKVAKVSVSTNHGLPIEVVRSSSRGKEERDQINSTRSVENQT